MSGSAKPHNGLRNTESKESRSSECKSDLVSNTKSMMKLLLASESNSKAW